MTVRRTTLGGTTYEFASLSDLLAKATPARSGDVLAGCAAESQAQRVAAQVVLADVPLVASSAVASPAVPVLASVDVTGAVVSVAGPLLELSSGSCPWSSAGHPACKVQRGSRRARLWPVVRAASTWT